MGFFKKILIAINVAVILLLWLCCLSSAIHPSIHPRAEVFGLLFPAILLVNLFFIIIWLFVKKRLILLPVFGIALCGSYVLDYFAISFPKTTPYDAIKIVTWNTKNYCGAYGDTTDYHTMKMYIDSCNADIYCFQEAQTNRWRDAEMKEFMESRGYTAVFTRNLHFYTRLKYVDYDSIPYPSNGSNRTNIYHVVYKGDTISVISNHFECNRISKEQKEELKSVIYNPSKDGILAEGKDIGHNVMDNVKIRGEQVDSVTAYLDSHKGENIILCGDFNDTPISYVYQQIAQRLTSAFRQSGLGLGLSYNQKSFPVRIDHLFVSPDWETFNAHIDNSIKASDHYPLIVWLKKRQK